MIRILGNDNNYFQETFAAYQIDQVVLVKKFLEERGCMDDRQPHSGKRTDLGNNHVLEKSPAFSPRRIGVRVRWLI